MLLLSMLTRLKRLRQVTIRIHLLSCSPKLILWTQEHQLVTGDLSCGGGMAVRMALRRHPAACGARCSSGRKPAHRLGCRGYRLGDGTDQVRTKRGNDWRSTQVAHAEPIMKNSEVDAEEDVKRRCAEWRPMGTQTDEAVLSHLEPHTLLMIMLRHYHFAGWRTLARLLQQSKRHLYASG